MVEMDGRHAELEAQIEGVAAERELAKAEVARLQADAMVR